MPVFEVSTCTQYEPAFRELSECPVDPDFGICYNLSVKIGQEFGQEPYDYVAGLFAAVMGAPREEVCFPLKEEGWVDGVRQRWCALFATACVTGVLDVPEDLMSTLITV